MLQILVHQLRKTLPGQLLTMYWFLSETEKIMLIPIVSAFAARNVGRVGSGAVDRSEVPLSAYK